MDVHPSKYSKIGFDASPYGGRDRSPCYPWSFHGGFTAIAGIFSEDYGETGGATASVAGAQPGDLSEGGSEMPMGSEKGLVEMASLDGL